MVAGTDSDLVRIVDEAEVRIAELSIRQNVAEARIAELSVQQNRASQTTQTAQKLGSVGLLAISYKPASKRHAAVRA